MYTTLNVTAAAALPQKDDAQLYALRRLEAIEDDKIDQLREDFEIDGKQPKTYGELKKWLADGNYRIDMPKGYTDDAQVNYWRENFEWGKDAPDTDGYEKARAALCKAKLAAVDTIKIMTDEKARLHAINTFAAWKQ